MKRNVLSPGANLITYKVYKNFLRIRLYLLKNFQSSIKCSTVLIWWCLASKDLIPKTVPLNLSTIEDFRPIALLNAEAKFCLVLMYQFKKVVWQQFLVFGGTCQWYEMSLKLPNLIWLLFDWMYQMLMDLYPTTLFSLPLNGVE